MDTSNTRLRRVRIIPKSRRAKNRVREHGEEFLADLSKCNYPDSILLLSLGNTWRGEQWLGWLSSQEADWIVL